MTHSLCTYVHSVYSLEVEKRGLSAYDNKRYLLDDGEHTLAFGHRDIPAGDVVEFDADGVPTFDDEHIEARIAVDRDMPAAARSPPPPPLPDDPIDYVIYAARHKEPPLPTLPGIEQNDFELLFLLVWDALENGLAEAHVRESVQRCIALVGDNEAFTQAMLEIGD